MSTDAITRIEKLRVHKFSDEEAAQARLVDSVVEQAKKLSVKINSANLLPMGIAAFVCSLAYVSLLLWVGFRIGSGQAHPPAMLLRMPFGMLMGGLCFGQGYFSVF
jgi:1,4-dihydroxy-2-naphthoate octaprenyltransferase